MNIKEEDLNRSINDSTSQDKDLTEILFILNRRQNFLKKTFLIYFLLFYHLEFLRESSLLLLKVNLLS